MEKNKLTKELLADSFRELMLNRDFEKITIKHITDGAGVIRPTFYYHYQDKYDVLEYILCRDVIRPVEEKLKARKEKEAISSCFKAIEKDKEFYRRAFRVTGQNAFDEMMVNHLRELWIREMENISTVFKTRNRLLTRYLVAQYYAVGLTNIIKYWLEEHKIEATAEELTDAYIYLVSHSAFDKME